MCFGFTLMAYFGIAHGFRLYFTLHECPHLSALTIVVLLFLFSYNIHKKICIVCGGHITKLKNISGGASQTTT
jgi:hypothetical protein